MDFAHAFAEHPWSCIHRSCGTSMVSRTPLFLTAKWIIRLLIHIALGLPPLKVESESLKQPWDLPLALIQCIYTIIIMSEDVKSQEFDALQYTPTKTLSPHLDQRTTCPDPTGWAKFKQKFHLAGSIQCLSWKNTTLSVYQWINVTSVQRKNKIETTEAKFVVTRKPHNQTLATTLDHSSKSSNSDLSLPKK